MALDVKLRYSLDLAKEDPALVDTCYTLIQSSPSDVSPDVLVICGEVALEVCHIPNLYSWRYSPCGIFVDSGLTISNIISAHGCKEHCMPKFVYMFCLKG
jgi:hypothetical protein